MGDADDDKAVNAASRAARIREAQRREKALESLRHGHHPVSSEPGTLLPGVVTGGQFDEVVAVVGAMLADPECFVIVGLAGDHPASESALARVVAEGIVSAVVCSGAVLVADLPAGAEPAVERSLAGWPEGKTLTTTHLCAGLAGSATPGGLLASAAAQRLPIVVPALADSALGVALALHNADRRRQGLRGVVVDPLADLEDLAAKASALPALGLLTVGGGAPRAFADQLAPWLQRRHERWKEAPPPHLRYDVRMGPDTWVALADRVLTGLAETP